MMRLWLSFITKAKYYIQSMEKNFPTLFHQTFNELIILSVVIKSEFCLMPFLYYFFADGIDL